MSPELRIALGLSGDKVSVAITGPKVPGGLVVMQRPLLQLNAEALEALSKGDIDEDTYGTLVQELNSWLLDKDTRQILTDALSNNGPRLRVVFVVRDEVRALMSGLPLELLWHDTPDSPLVVREDVKCLVYRLDKSGNAPSSPAASNWPFKVLIVRSSPPDLDEVPKVTNLRKHILDLGQRFGQDMVQVDVISNEDGIGKPATWSGLQAHLDKTNDYGLLVYLGHGEIIRSSGEPVGQLFMESEDGGGHQPITSGQIAKLLRYFPIPVVLLTGCLTGADPPGQQRRRGVAQGVAQALVNSSIAGVQVAVGMRTELRTDAAEQLLKEFFTALLHPKTAGDIDAAVWSARSRLFMNNPFPPSWAAPVVFRAIETEPLLEYLAQPVSFRVSPEMDKLLVFRAKLWKFLPDRRGDALLETKAAVADIEQLLRAEGVKIGPLLMPEHTIVAPGQRGQILVTLVGKLAVSRLSGRIQLASAAAAVTEIRLSNAATVAGFNLKTNPAEKNFFDIKSSSGEKKSLPAGELLDVTVEAAPGAAPGVHAVTLEIETIQPNASYWPGDNVLVVPPA